MHYATSLKKYKKKNRIRGSRPIQYLTIRMDMSKCTNASPNSEYFTHCLKTPYRAYFHLWLEKLDQTKKFDIDCVMIKCHVPKHLITAVGTEKIVEKTTYIMETDDPEKMGTTEIEYRHIPTIVSKGFDIVDYKCKENC